MKRETELNAKLGEAIKLELPGSIYFKLKDDATSGIPDFTVTWRGLTSWHEVKVAEPEFDCPGIQELTCCRLARHGHCDFIIYDDIEKTVSIVPPKSLANWRQSGVTFPGLNHKAVAAAIRELHEKAANQ